MDYAKAAVNEFKAEIGGMAVLVPDEDSFEIKEPVILKQEVTGSTCTLDKEELANYYTRTMKKMGTNISFVWWHSHGDGSTFWSGTDETAIKEFGGGKWSVSLVVNAEEDYKLRIDWFTPKHVSMEDTELEVIGDNSKVIPKAIIDEVKDKCSKPAPTYNTYGSKAKNGNQMNLTNGWGGYNNSYYSGYNVHDDEVEDPNIDIAADFNTAISDVNDALEDYQDQSLKYNDVRKIVKDVNKAIESLGQIKLPKKKHLDAYQKHNSPLADAIRMFRTKIV